MGANTIYYVTVQKLCEEVVQISALTAADAKEKALHLSGVCGLTKVQHRSSEEIIPEEEN